MMERRDFLKSLFGVAAAAAAVSVVGLPNEAEAAALKAQPKPDQAKNPAENPTDAIPDAEPKDGEWSQYYYYRRRRPYWGRPYRPYRPYWGPRYYYRPRPRYYYRPRYYRRRYW